MAVTRTYAVGENSTVKRLTNHTLPWVDVSIPTGPIGDWKINDVMADPNDPNKLTVVGVTFGAGTGSGIMVSYDAGANWFEPSGSFHNGKEFFEVWYVDSIIIWAVGEFGLVVKSTDGGLTFNATANRPGLNIGDTKAIHALDENIAVVAGSFTGDPTQAFAWKTIDGGFSWIPLNGGATLQNTIGVSGVPGTPNGIHISADQQTIIVTTGYTQNRSTDGGVTFTDLAPDMERSGVHLTWFPSHDPSPTYMRHVGGPIFQVNNSTVNGAAWNITRSANFDIIRAAHFYAPVNGYYAIGSNIYSTTDGGITGALSLFGNMAFDAIWTQSNIQIYRLIDCEGNYSDQWSSESFLAPYVSLYINIDSPFFPSSVCWRVELETNSLNPITDVDAVLGSFQLCEDCLPEPPDDRCWDLLGCTEACDDILNVGNYDFTLLENQLVYLNNDQSCVYTVRSKRQAFFVDLRYADLSNPAGNFQLGLDNYTLEVTSLIFNSTEYVTAPVTPYILTPVNYQPIDCTGLTCGVVAPNTTENAIDNTALYLDQVFTAFGIALEAAGTDPAGCDYEAFNAPTNFFKIQYRNGDTFTITMNITNSSGTSTWIFDVASGNITTETQGTTPPVLTIITCNSNLYCEPNDPIPPLFTQVDQYPFEDCPAEPIEVVLGEACEIVPRLGEVGFSWKNCDPKTVINTKSLYADSVFALFKRLRYGIETCCEYDLDKIDVKNTLLDLGALYDPDLCIDLPVPVDCCLPPCNVIAQLFISLAQTCPAPTLVIVELTTDEPLRICYPPSGLIINGQQNRGATAELLIG